MSYLTSQTAGLTASDYNTETTQINTQAELEQTNNLSRQSQSAINSFSALKSKKPSSFSPELKEMSSLFDTLVDPKSTANTTRSGNVDASPGPASQTPGMEKSTTQTPDPQNTTELPHANWLGRISNMADTGMQVASDRSLQNLSPKSPGATTANASNSDMRAESPGTSRAIDFNSIDQIVNDFVDAMVDLVGDVGQIIKDVVNEFTNSFDSLFADLFQ